MRNGTRKNSAPSVRAHQKTPRRGLDIVTKPSSEARKRIAAWGEMLTRQTKEHTGRTVAMALGAGYVLGGGLFSRLTARIVGTGIRVGFRMILVPFVTQSLVSIGDSMWNRDAGPRDDDDDDSSSPSRSERRSDEQHSNQKET